VILDEDQLRAGLDELTERPAPPPALDASEAIVRGRLLVRRRRIRRGCATLAAGLAAVLAGTLIPAHGAGSPVGTPLSGSATDASAAPARPSGTGTDPLTLSGTFGWLPANAQNVGYSLHSGQLQAVARGPATNEQSPGSSALIWLTVYPTGTTPTLGKFADGSTQLRVDAPDVNGHTAYWVTNAANDPTDGGDTYLRWQDADGQWGELHGYYLGNDPITSTLLRVAAGVDFAPHAVPLPLWISGLPSSVVAVETDLNRPSQTDGVPWDVYLALSVGGTTVEITVVPTSTQADASVEQGTPKPQCKHQDGLTGCVVVTANGVGSAASVLKHLTLLGTDPAGWTPDVIVH
jgi:hypothetical protein